MDVRDFIAANAAGADLTDILGAPLVSVAAGLDADRIHAPNEYVDLSRARHPHRSEGTA